jgi:hypothetical protein
LALLALTAVSAGATALAVPAPPQPPPAIPPVPKGPQTTCITTGPPWLAYGIHTPNAPPRGNKYRVSAWGIPCSQAKTLLRALAPRIPPNRDATIPGPQGFTCKSRGDGASRNRVYTVGCLRRTPAATFGWEATGGTVA